MASITKVTRRARGKTYEYHAVRFSDPGTGQERIRYFGTHKEALRARTEIEGRLSVGTYSPDAHKITVREVAGRWRNAGYSPRRADELRSTTATDYEGVLTRYVLPRWGAVRMTEIRAGMLETWRNELLEKGVEPEWKPIGASTVRKALLVLGIIFRFAMRDHIVAVNPAALVRKPAVRTRKAADERLTPEQLVGLFDKLAGRTRIVVRVAAATGMREAELFGLRWSDVDLKARTLTVRRQFTHGEFVEFPKTDAGHRTIGFDAKLATELATWKLAQKPERRKDSALVISTHQGGPISASNFLAREWRPALEAAGLPQVTFHSLRHTAATILASSNTPPGTVHRILGHASFATTMKLYGGLTAEALESAAGTLADAFEPKADAGKESPQSA
jgi:integrase